MTGPILNEIKEKNPDLKLTGRINHDEVMNLLDRTDIFVHPSESEGMPTAILEAGLMKCAVVATPVGGTTEIIPSEEVGKICDLEVESIKEKMEELILDKEKREKLQNNIHNRIIENFTWQVAAGKMASTINYK